MPMLHYFAFRSPRQRLALVVGSSLIFVVAALALPVRLNAHGAVAAAVTVVDGNGAVTGDRVFKVLSSASAVSLSGLTIRNGRSLSTTVGVIGGGGLYMEGAGQLQLSGVSFESNTGQNGGALYTNF